MQFFISPTDFNWYRMLKDQAFDEVNFWRPGSTAFRALQPGELFLFKLKHPHDAIAGGGYFVSYSLAPIDLAWQAFGMKNGTNTEAEFKDRLAMYRDRNNISLNIPTVGCIILSNPFFFEERDWIRRPNDWPSSAVGGKRYDNEDKAEGQRVYRDILDKLQLTTPNVIEAGEQLRYGQGMSKFRLGQGAFHVLVADTYLRRCAVSGEKTLPVLQAAHIIPYSSAGESTIQNGILLRSDLHTLFDTGYLTITTDFRVEVSHRLKEDYGNGKDYYKHHGSSLAVLPTDMNLMPARESLQWHNQNVFLG